MKAAKITIGRLYNLGSYEHVRYEISVEVGMEESARDALLGVEKILEGLKPESKCCVKSLFDLERGEHRIKELRAALVANDEGEFRRKHGHFVGTPEEYVARCEESQVGDMAKREAYERRARHARWLLDHLGGAAEWKDAKLDWENDDGDHYP